jgi:hypothetical protein
MPETKTPKWLIDTQNKSWEPEILISGITLTFLFILSNYIFNFYGMMIQELNVRYIVGRNFYIVSIIILTGLKVGLIFHLILRGLWTGFVGLSYVFPEGINKKKLPESKRKFNFHKPETFVIKLEKVCSLLFSFIFSSIIFIGSFCLGMIPFALLYIAGLDVSTIKIIILYIILPFYMVIGIIWIILASRKKTPKIIERTENTIFSNILTTYFTNLGKTKTLLVFIVYFMIISLISLPNILNFDFKNNNNVDIFSDPDLIHLKKEHYRNKADNNVRISKAAIDQFWVTGNTIELFISFYKEDLYTITNLKADTTPLKELGIKADSVNINLKSLYHIYIDDKHISNLNWYSKESSYTNQKGIITKITLDSLSTGYHEIKINKVFWVDKKKKIEVIENWDVIPFELERNAARTNLSH